MGIAGLLISEIGYSAEQNVSIYMCAIRKTGRDRG